MCERVCVCAFLPPPTCRLTGGCSNGVRAWKHSAHAASLGLLPPGPAELNRQKEASGGVRKRWTAMAIEGAGELPT